MANEDLGEWGTFVPSQSTATAEPEPNHSDLGEWGQFVPKGAAAASPTPTQDHSDLGEWGQFVPPPPSPAPETLKAVEETKSIVPREFAQADAQRAIESNARGPQWAENAAAGLAETVKGFIPRSVGQAAQMVTPVASLPHEIVGTVGAIKDWIQGKPIPQINQERFPEAAVLAEADKTPAFSKERFSAGFGVLANMAMGAGIVKGMTKAPTAEPVSSSEPEFTASDNPQYARFSEAPKEAAPSAETQTPPEIVTPQEQVATTDIPPEVTQPVSSVEQAPVALGEQKEVVTGEAAPPVPVEEPRITSTKNVVVDEERTARGLEPIAKEAAQANPETWIGAEQKLIESPDYGKVLVRELNEGARQEISATDEAVLLREKIGAQNAREAAGERAIDPTLSEGEKVEARRQYDELENHINNIDQATYKSGAIWGRLGQFRQRLARDDFSLVAMERRKRVAKGGQPLTPQETGEIKAQHQQLRNLESKIEVKRRKLAERTAEQKLATRKKALITRTEKLQEKVEAGDFSRPERTQITDKELDRLLFDYNKVKRDFNNGLFRDKLEQRSAVAKVIGAGTEALNTTRAIITSADLSAVLRQGGFIGIAHPVRALSSFPAMLKAFASERGQFKVNEQIRNRPNATLYQQSKLYLNDEANPSLSKMEEAYMSRWAEKIPLVAGSQRAYTTFLNKLRADSFDAMAKSLSKDGGVTIQEAKAISNFINVATGRGYLGGAGQAAVGLNTVFFAPRYVASRFELLAGQPFYHGTAKTRLLIANEYARYLVGMGVVYGLAKMAGGQIETDSRSADFGKVQLENTRIDPLSGLSQSIVVLSRVGMGETKTASGKIVPIRGGNVPFGTGNSADVLARFLRSKLSPAFGTAVDVATGKNVVGDPVTPQSAATRMVVPLSLNDILDSMKEQGIPRGTAMALLSIFGMGLQTYQPKQSGSNRPSAHAVR